MSRWKVIIDGVTLDDSECPHGTAIERKKGNTRIITRTCAHHDNMSGKCIFANCPLPKELIVFRQTKMTQFLEIASKEIAHISNMQFGRFRVTKNTVNISYLIPDPIEGIMTNEIIPASIRRGDQDTIGMVEWIRGGHIKPIVVDKNWMVLDGHHRLGVLRYLSKTEGLNRMVPVWIIDADRDVPGIMDMVAKLSRLPDVSF